MTIEESKENKNMYYIKNNIGDILLKVKFQNGQIKIDGFKSIAFEDFKYPIIESSAKILNGGGKNGIQIEDLIKLCILRMEVIQQDKIFSESLKKAIEALKYALNFIQSDKYEKLVYVIEAMKNLNDKQAK
jgi:hypothetical protein